MRVCVNRVARGVLEWITWIAHSLDCYFHFITVIFFRAFPFILITKNGINPEGNVACSHALSINLFLMRIPDIIQIICVNLIRFVWESGANVYAVIVFVGNEWELTQSHSPRNSWISGTTHSKASAHRYIVSASTSPNHTWRFGEKLSPVSSSIATSPPPFKFSEFTMGTGVTGDLD